MAARLACALLLPLSVALALVGCSDKPDKPRRQQSVKLLPDTPPPPPPRPEERPPPKPQEKQQQDAPKPAEAPQPQALKSDEAAGSGPGSGLTAGAVTREYTDQKIGQAPTVGAPASADSGANRLAMNAFGNAATRSLNEFLVRDRTVKLRDYRVRVQLWLTPTGSLQRAELLDSTGDPQTDEALRAALNRFPGTSDPPPARLPQPMRVLLSNRLLG